MLKSYHPAENILHTDVDDGAVLLHQDAGVYFGLNPVGALIWSHINDRIEAEKILDLIVENFDVKREVAQEDYIQLTNDLLSQGLIKAS